MAADEDIEVGEFYAAATGLISEKPGWLYSLVFASTGAAPNTIVIHDGQDTSGKIELTLSIDQYVTVPIIFSKAKYFSKGLYLSVSAGTVYVAFQYREARK